MELETMRIEVEEGVMTVTLNRPDRLNAFTVPMLHDWFSVLDRADEDDDVRALIVTGAGRGFCAGPTSKAARRPSIRRRRAARPRLGSARGATRAVASRSDSIDAGSR